MAVVQVGIVRMSVPQPLMAMPMRMGFDDRSVMLVLMVLVMDMAVLMFERFMNMRMLVPLGKMHPQSKPHQRGRNHELWRQGVMQKQDGHHGADKRRKGEICARSRGSQMAQRQHEQDQADADPQEADYPRADNEGNGRRRRPAPQG